MTYTIQVLTPTLGTSSETLRVSSLQGGIAVGAVGTLTIETAPTKAPRLWLTDTPILLYRSVDGTPRLVGQTVWFLRSVMQRHSNGGVIQTLTFYSANDLLRRRIVAYAAGSSNAMASGATAGEAMTCVVDYNLQRAAGVGRDISSYLSVAGSADGAQISMQFSRRNVLSVLADMADASAQAGTPVWYDIVWEGGRLVFRVYAGTRGKDWSQRGIFAPIDGAWVSFDWRDEANYVYTGGQGEEALREVVEVSDSTRVGASPFNRCEVWYSRADISNTASLTDAGNAYLRQSLPKARIGGTVSETRLFRYGRDWDIGDRFMIAAHGYTASADVKEILFAWASGTDIMAASLEGEVET